MFNFAFGTKLSELLMLRARNVLPTTARWASGLGIFFFLFACVGMHVLPRSAVSTKYNFRLAVYVTYYVLLHLMMVKDVPTDRSVMNGADACVLYLLCFMPQDQPTEDGVSFHTILCMLAYAIV